MPIEPKRVQSVFLLAVEANDPAERATILDRECGPDVELRRRVQALLVAHDAPGSFLQQPAVLDSAGAVPAAADPASASSAPEPITEKPGTILGRYKLLQQLGVGGMGVVFLAEQLEPVRRQVALKIVKAGLDSARVVARFEQERQALALMDHPNIAKVLDAGTTEPILDLRTQNADLKSEISIPQSAIPQGRPYFVMELVKGIPINKFCDHEQLTPRERLELFIPVCQAVQHAHQKGIIHRDLKPSNVLIALYDGKPIPKVIDFGVAKATQRNLTEKTLFTEVGSMVGTLEYMAPEQAELNNLDIDTRADIYSLGVLLYELLTGSPPFTSRQLRSVAFTEMLRMIREVEPSKPSTKLSSSEELPGIAARRKLEPKKLTRQVQGDLDWVVMKCLEKDRGRRYETANGLAMEIQRYLDNEPVLAGPPSKTYRLRKFLSRNKGSVLAVAVIILALVAGVVGTSWGLVVAERAWEAEAKQRQAAEENEGIAQAAAKSEAQQRQAAEEARKGEAARAAGERRERLLAEKRLTQIEKANELLGSIFKDLNPNAAEKEGKPLQALLGERLDQAVKELEGEAIGDPLVVANLQNTLGLSLLGLGYAHKAVGLFERARATFTAKLEPGHPCILSSMNNLALAYQAIGKLDLALTLHEETHNLTIANLGPVHPETLASMDNLASANTAVGKFDGALALYEKALELRKATLGPDHPSTLTSMNNLASAYLAAGKFEQALPLLEKTFELMKAKRGPDHPSTLTSMNNLAQAYQNTGKQDLALSLIEETFKLTKATLGPDHPSTLASMINLATAYTGSGKLNLGLSTLVEAFKRHKAKLGPDHPATLTCMNNLAQAYKDVGKLDLAVPLLEETLKLRKTKIGLEHPDTLTTMGNLGSAYQYIGKLDLALPLLEKTLELRKATVGPEHPFTLSAMNSLATAYMSAGKYDLGVPLIEEAFKLKKTKSGPTHPVTLVYMNNLAFAYWKAGKLDLSVPLFEEAVKLRKAKLGPDHLDSLTALTNLAVNYRDTGRLQDTIVAYEEVLDRIEKSKKPFPPRLMGVPMDLAKTYTEAGMFTKAEPLARQVLADAKKRYGPADLRAADPMAILGMSLLGQMKWAEAEDLLRECLTIQAEKQPDVWNTFLTKSRLGGALLGQKKYPDAQQLLLAGYEGMKQREAKIPPNSINRLVEALERLVQLYEATEQQDKAEESRRQLNAARKTNPKE